MTPEIDVVIGQYPQKGEVLIFLGFEDSFKKNELLNFLDKKTSVSLSKRLTRQEYLAKEGEMVMIESPPLFDLIVFLGLGKEKDFNFVKLKNSLANSFRKISSLKHKSVQLYYDQKLGKDTFELGKSLALSYHLANYRFLKFKSRESQKKIKIVEKLTVIFDKKYSSLLPEFKHGVEIGSSIADGIYLTRNLVNEPASHVHPEILASVAGQIAKDSKSSIEVQILEENECRKLGMGSFLGVAQGSERKPKFIVLHYLPKTKSKAKVCLVGKSITFDSGGLSLKPADFMMDMKIDMAGGATVLGVFKILSLISNLSNWSNLKCEVYGILPACENMPSGKALRPGDVVTALNGKTIEVLNTDAEGRLALADALSYAEKFIKPDYMIDLATLTGACMVALGKDLTGMFGNNESFLREFEKISKAEGDELWTLPLYKPYAQKMKSDIADLKNIGGGRYGGAITAAVFLAEFVTKSKWIHLDIAGPAYNDEAENGIVPKGGTGWGVATIVEWLKNFR